MDSNIRNLKTMLFESGIEKSEAQAEIDFILKYVLNIKFEDIILGKKNDENLFEKAFEIVKKRATTKQPLMQILGFTIFMDNKFLVSKDTLIPRVETESYLNKLPSKLSNQLRELLAYKEDTAGGIMNPRVLTINQEMKVDDALSFIRTKAIDDNTELFYLYVTDKQKHLLGVVSLRNLLTSNLSTRIEQIMIRDIVRLHVDDPQDMVAEIFMKYQYNALPVVDLYNRLQGIVTWDDVQDVVEEETTEEIYTSSGIATDVFDEDDILSGKVINSVRARTPWLFITLIGEFFAVFVANKFDSTLAVLPITAIFMPLLAGLGGNIGTQSITLIVRGLSTGQVNLKKAFKYIFREFGVGLAIGLLFGVLVMITTIKWQHNIELGFIVGLAMVVNMTLATLIGTITPFLLKSLKIDPAIASGPVIATSIDVVGLFIYFTLVTTFLVNKIS